MILHIKLQIEQHEHQ